MDDEGELLVGCPFAQLMQACSLRNAGWVNLRQASPLQSESLIGPVRFREPFAVSLAPAGGVRRYFGMLERDVSGF